MAQNAPPSQDVQDIQFKLHDKFPIFPEAKEAKSLVSLLAVSSAKGLLFAGNPNGNELKVFKIHEVVDGKTSGQEIKVRVVKLPSEPKVLACSCDGSMLAVNYVLNNTGFLQIYQVESFIAPTLNCLYELPVAPESNVFALQILWNPVITNNIALILTDGSVAMFTLNNGQYDKVTLSKEHQVKSGCWSPKGKQIVFGFPDGKLQQFKPNLQPARAIPCPPGIYPGPFDCIAVHWLSTFQFAVIFLQRGQDMCPSMLIVNAPKVGQPSYINYYDVCFSTPGPRVQQLSFHHISQWNLLLVTSANGVEVGVLGTKDSGETPHWTQYTLLDEARIEMPLTESKDETYPLGVAFDTASTHQVIIREKQMPVMPMIHVVTTHGHLVCYNFLNLTQNAVDVCSPPPPVNDVSGQFVPLKDTLVAGMAAAVSQSKPTGKELNTEAKTPVSSSTFGDMTFTLGTNVITSTPTIKEKPLALFGVQQGNANTATAFGLSQPTTAALASSATGFGFADTSAPTAAQFSQLGDLISGTTFGGFTRTGFTDKPGEPTNQQAATQQPANTNKSNEINKPLYTVPATFTPPPVQQQAIKTETKPIKPKATTSAVNLNTGEIDEVVKQMIVIQMNAFEMELRQIRQQSKHLMENIGSPDAIKSYTKHLNDLQEIIQQADDHEFEQDVQSLRHSMNESYAMLAECRTKLDLYNNPNLTRLSVVSSTDPTSRRQLAKLQAYVAANQNQMSQLNQLIDAQWSQYQDVVRRNTKNQMHIPCLDGIYQRMSKLKDLLARQRTKMNYIKTKLKQKGLNYKSPTDMDITSLGVGALAKNQSTMESLADSILSMSLSQVVSQTQAKLSEEKLNAIRNFTKCRPQVAIIKPKRPDRIGLKSEVILETKLETERKQNEIAKKQQQQQVLQQQYQQMQQQQQFAAYKTSLLPQKAALPQTKMQQHLIKPQATISTSQQAPILAKPTASKPSIAASQTPSFITPTSSTAATLSFGGNSSFVKTSLANAGTKADDIAKPVATSKPFSGFGSPTTQSGLSFGQPKAILNESKENQAAPISFSAKVISGSDGAKPFTNLGNKSNTVVQPPQQGFAGPASTGFSAFATTKATSQLSSQEKGDVKKTEETPKQFSFSTTTASATSAPFTGFAVTSKPATTSTSLFGGSLNTNTSTPFAALSSSSSFPFDITVSSSSKAPSSTTANNQTKALTKTTTSSQPLEAVASTSTEIKTTLTISSTSAATATNTSTGFSFNNPVAANATVISTKSSAAPNVTITSSVLPNPTVATVASTSSSSPASTTTTTIDPTDSVFGSLNICKPNVKEAGDSNKSSNIFSAFATTTSTASIGPFSFASASGAGDGAKSFLSSTNTTGTATSTAFSFASAVSTAATTGNVSSKSVTAGTTTDTDTTSSTTDTLSLPPLGAPPVIASTTSSFSFGTTAPLTASSAGSLFGSLSLSSSTPASATTTATIATTSTAAGNIFSGGSPSFGQATPTATTSTTSSIFGAGAAMVASPSLFGSTATVTTVAATSGAESIFSAAAGSTSSAGNLFGGIPKPEQSVFSSAITNTQSGGTGLFAAAAAAAKPPVTTGGSIFGGGSTTGFAASTGSIFGGGSNAASIPFGSSAPAANTAGSIFAAAAATTKPPEGGGIFCSPTQQSATSGGSLFAKSAFSGATATQSPGSIFGGAASPTSGSFGASGGSIFSGSTSANTSASGGSIFCAAAPTTGFGASTASPGFGSFSQPSNAPAFGSPSAGGFGAQASTGFVSPQQQSAFAKPVFGGPATFGSPQPVFGAAPTFGGAPTFGSPKGFGSFAATSPTTTGFGTATLGSQNSNLSFGNLANSTQTQQPKPSFGGSSFMNYRS